MREVLGEAAPSDDQVKEIIKHIDTDKSGDIDFREFMAMMSDPRFNDPAKNEHRQAFEMFDKDRNGRISIAELKEAFDKIGKFLVNSQHTYPSLSGLRFLLGDRLNDEEIDQIVKAADLDGDKHINYEEFLQVGTDSRPPAVYTRAHALSSDVEVLKCNSREGGMLPTERLYYYKNNVSCSRCRVECCLPHRHSTPPGHPFSSTTIADETTIRTTQACDLRSCIQEEENDLVLACLHHLFYHLFLLIHLSPRFEPLWVIIDGIKPIASRRVGTSRSPTLRTQFRLELAKSLVQGQ